MSEAQVARLEALLSRVQQNRRAPRLAQPMAASAPHAAPAPVAPLVSQPAAAAAPRAAQAPTRERPSVLEERVHVPERVSAAAARPVSAGRPETLQDSRERLLREPTERVRLDAQEERRPRRDRTATPLELAVEGEIARGTATPMGLETAPAAPARERQPAPAPLREPSSPSLEMPLTFEPEPPREPARPIAQVMSKHTAQVEVTFGALLKHSLSLRPR